MAVLIFTTVLSSRVRIGLAFFSVSILPSSVHTHTFKVILAISLRVHAKVIHN